MFRFFALLLIAGGAVAPSLEAREGPRWTAWAFQGENDAIALFSGSDEFYTTGTRLFGMRHPEATPSWAATLAERLRFGSGPATTRVGFALGQNLYTPDDLSIAELIPRRPSRGRASRSAVAACVSTTRSCAAARSSARGAATSTAATTSARSPSASNEPSEPRTGERRRRSTGLLRSAMLGGRWRDRTAMNVLALQDALTPNAAVLPLTVEQYHRMVDAGILAEGEPVLRGAAAARSRRASGCPEGGAPR